MADFIVRGVDKLTGRQVEHRIEATDRDEAQAVANGMGVAVEAVEPVDDKRQPGADAALDDRLRRIEDAIEVNSKLSRAIAFEIAEIRRALTERKSAYFDALYRKVVWAVAIGIILSSVLVFLIGFGLMLILAALGRGLNP
ncbi:MAG: hypothetical protein RIE32_07185 [Phycisphaerales bacterium]